MHVDALISLWIPIVGMHTTNDRELKIYIYVSKTATGAAYVKRMMHGMGAEENTYMNNNLR